MMRMKVLSVVLGVCIILTVAIKVPAYQQYRAQINLEARLAKDLRVLTQKNRLDPNFAKMMAMPEPTVVSPSTNENDGSENKKILSPAA